MDRLVRVAQDQPSFAMTSPPAPNETAQPPETAPPGPAAATHTGDIRVHEKIGSRFLPTTRTVLVWLPPGYEAQPERRFPVLYLHDGQNVFDAATAFGGNEWGVDETAQRLVEEGAIDPLIIVGIYNAGDKRIEEYTPTQDRRKRMGGGGEQYGYMLFEEIKPMIDSTYRTLGDASNTGLGGSSLGGLLSLHLALRHVGKVGRVALLSPSVWWDNQFIVRRVRGFQGKPSMRVWLSVGTAEGPDVAEAARRLREALTSKGWQPDIDFKYVEFEGAGHSEQAWAAQIPEVLRYLFPRQG